MKTPQNFFFLKFAEVADEFIVLQCHSQSICKSNTHLDLSKLIIRFAKTLFYVLFFCTKLRVRYKLRVVYILVVEFQLRAAYILLVEFQLRVAYILVVEIPVDSSQYFGSAIQIESSLNFGSGIQVESSPHIEFK